MQKAAKHIYVEVVYLTSVFLRHAVFFCLDMQGLIFIRKYKKKRSWHSADNTWCKYSLITL